MENSYWFSLIFYPLFAVGAFCLNDIEINTGANIFAFIFSIPTLRRVVELKDFDTPTVEDVTFKRDNRLVLNSPHIVDALGSLGRESIGTTEVRLPYRDGENVAV